MKHIHDLKTELREKGWTQRDLPQEVHQPSFLRGINSDAELGFKYELRNHPNNSSPQNYIVECVL